MGLSWPTQSAPGFHGSPQRLVAAGQSRRMTLFYDSEGAPASAIPPTPSAGLYGSAHTSRRYNALNVRATVPRRTQTDDPKEIHPR